MLFFESGYNWNHAVLEIEVPEVSYESAATDQFVSATNHVNSAANNDSSASSDRVVQRLFIGNAPPPQPKLYAYEAIQ